MFSDPPFLLQPGSSPIVTGLSRFPCYKNKNKKEKDIPFQIKKENIGLIEVMGLAVLPARLKKEMALLEQYILEKQDVRSNPQIEKHADWVDSWLGSYEITEDNIHAILQKEIGKVFVQVLECAGVYKNTKEGRIAFGRFIETL